MGAGWERPGGLKNNLQVLHFNIWSSVIVFEVGKMGGVAENGCQRDNQGFHFKRVKEC